MAVVYAGWHTSTHVPVAVKIVTGSSLNDADESFRNEVLAIARMHHPHIVAVFDQGTVDHAAVAMGLPVEVGAPYLVMERAAGTLADFVPGAWPLLRTLLLQSLSALAHAHARGVIHRDIKPGNLLLCAPASPRPGLKLADFGIAEAGLRTVGEGQIERAIGTPMFMAPEQIRGRWRDYGPWTDLYALGIVGWVLATGAHPFATDAVGHQKVLAMTQAHIHEVPGRFEPFFDVPRGLEAWLRRLVAKAPGDRFGRAADAAWALRTDVDLDVAHSGINPVLADLWDDVAQQTQLLPDTIAEPSNQGEPATVAIPNSASSSTAADAASAHWSAPPFPANWSRAESHEPELRVSRTQGWGMQVGLSLFPIRDWPVRARHSERDRLWAALRQTRDQGRPHMVLLTGPIGVGASRMARWLCETAHEAGQAEVGRALGATGSRYDDGLQSLVADLLGIVGLGFEAACSRIADMHSDWDWDGTARSLAAYVSPADVEVSRPGAVDVRTAIARVLAHMAQRRPVLLYLDDLHLGPDAQSLAEYLLEHRHRIEGPILVVATASTQPGPALSRLVEQPGVEHIELSPLSEGDQLGLVEQILHLDEPTAHQVARRSGGLPLFSVQLLQQWVQRGALVASRSGLRLRHGADVPEDLASLWRTRLHNAIGGIEGGLDAVRVGAALGLRVDQDVWHRSCRELGLTPPADIGEALARSGLAHWERAHWRLSHPMLREVIVADGRAGGEWARTCGACADAILAVPVDAADAGAVADLLVEAGQPRRASPHYERHAEYLRHTGDLTGCRTVLGRWETALAGAEVPAYDARWGRLWCRRAAMLSHTDVAAGLVLARRALDSCLRHSWAEIEALCRRTVGLLIGNHGDLEAAVVQLALAVEAAERCDDEADLVATVVLHAELLRRLNRWDESLALFSRCASMSLPDTPSRAKMFVLAANALVDTGERNRALAYLDEADRILARMPAEHIQLQATFTRGEIARTERRLDVAEVAYRRCLQGFAERGASRWVLAMRMNLALCSIAQGRTEPARGWLAGCADHVNDTESLAPALACVFAAANLGHDDAAMNHWRELGRTLNANKPGQNPVLKQMLTWAAEDADPATVAVLEDLVCIMS